MRSPEKETFGVPTDENPATALNMPISLGDFVAVKQRFARSANLERDADSDAIDGYLPTARALDVVARIISAIERPSVGRSLSITGPYGSGKSSLALFLAGLFSPAAHPTRAAAETILRAADHNLADRFLRCMNALGAESSGFVRAVVTAQREPIMATILRSLRVGVTRFSGDDRAARRVPAFRAILEADTADLKTATHLRRLIEDVSHVAPILMVLDEFGKNLEYLAASGSADTADIYILQELGEAAGGGDALPLVLVTLQHLALEEYVGRVTASERREWSKVMGRFVDVPYVEARAQAQILIASVFEYKERAPEILHLDEWAAAARDDLEGCGLQSAVHVNPAFCYPLHPVTVAVLPDLCARYGQNERTLFSFLAGSDPCSVSAYLAEMRLPVGRRLPSIRPDRVYDYFLQSASTMVGASSTASRWLEIETRIRDSYGHSEAELRILKTVGVLNLVSAGGAIRASKRLVAVTCADGQPGTETQLAVEDLITILEAKGLLTYRGFADEYRVWAGTDFDLKGAVELALRRIQEEPLAALLQRTRPLPPIVAARHSQRMGTLRIFERRYVDRDTLASAQLAASSIADGLALLCLDSDGHLLSDVEENPRGKPVILGFSKTVDDLAEAAWEFAAHLKVLDTAADLASDWVARRELRERTAVAMQALDAALERAFGTSSPTVRWIRLPSDAPLGVGGSLSTVLSSLCDELYPDTPQIRNEMLARRDLTSQGAKARRDLLEAMVEHSGQLSLGLDGYGPERAMYESVLRRSGIHRQIGGMWSFGPPDEKDDPLGFGPAWAELETGFQRAAERQVTVSDLVERLMAPPIGLKDGPIPVFITAGLLAHADDVALYEEGTFVPRLTPDLTERLARNPSKFTIKSFGIRGPRGDVVATLGEALGVAPKAFTKNRVPSVVAVVSELLAKIRNLPAYTQRTKNAASTACALRDALVGAREPDELLFTALPVALGLRPVPPIRPRASKAEQYVAALLNAIEELEDVFPRLLNSIEDSLTRSLGSKTTLLRHDARVRAERLVDRILEHQLKAFAHALADDQLDREDWLQYMAMVVAGKPVTSWSDDDVVHFEQQLAHLASAFRRVESLHFSRDSSPGEGFEAVRVTVTLSDGRDSGRVLWIDESARDMIAQVLDEALERTHSRIGRQGEQMLLAALATRILMEEGIIISEISPKDDIKEIVSNG